MNELQIFNFNSEVKIRTISYNNEPWFVAKDIASVLEYEATNKMTRRLDSDEKTNVPFRDNGSNYQTNITIINESGLYNAIIGSKMPEAKSFKKWITSEVLPSIRKTGKFIIGTSDDEIIMIGYKKAIEKIKQLENKVEADKPKVDNYNRFMDSSNLHSMNETAKLFIGLGRNKLFEILRNESILMDDNLPYQSYINRGYFEVKEKVIATGEAKAVTLVTAKGIDFISDILEDYNFTRKENK